MSCQCHQIGGPFIAEDPECPVHRDGGYEDRLSALEARLSSEQAAYREGIEIAAQTVRRMIGAENATLVLDVDAGVLADRATLVYVAEALESRAAKLLARHSKFG
jgi:hypothetical protein